MQRSGGIPLRKLLNAHKNDISIIIIVIFLIISILWNKTNTDLTC